MEAVEKKPGAAKTKHFHGEASKVVAQGNGLKKGFPGRPCTFNLEAKDAGTEYNPVIVSYGCTSKFTL